MKQLVQFIALALFAGGCATPQGLNPTDSEVEIEDSNSNTVYSVAINISTMRDQIVQDVLKDLLKDLFPTGIPDLPIVIPGDLPPDAGDKSPPATNNPPPVVPDEPVSGDAGGDQTFLWKPKYSPVKPAESGSGVALLPAAIPDPVSAELRVGGESIPASNISRNGHNGNRAHIRFEAEYPRGPGELITLFESGDARSWPIEDTHRRTY